MGFVEGRNLAIAFRWAEGHYDRLPGLAAELVGLPVTVLFSAGGPPSAFAAKAATSTIPIVFSAVSDPVEIGLVPSLNQPGGNITGMAVFNATLGEKRIELTKELIPTAGTIGYLLNPSDQMSELNQRARWPPRAHWASSYGYLTPHQKTSLMRFSPPWQSCRSVPSSRLVNRFWPPSAKGSWVFVYGTACPQSTLGASMLWRVVL